MGLQALLLSWAITNRGKPRAKHCFFQKHCHLVWLNLASQRPGPVEGGRYRRSFRIFLQEEKSLLSVSLFLFSARIDEHLSNFLKNSLQPHKEGVYQVTCCHCLKYCSPTHTSHMNNKNREVLGRC